MVCKNCGTIHNVYVAVNAYLNTKTNICVDAKMSSLIATAMMKTATNVDSPSPLLGQFPSLCFSSIQKYVFTCCIQNVATYIYAYIRTYSADKYTRTYTYSSYTNKLTSTDPPVCLQQQVVLSQELWPHWN